MKKKIDRNAPCPCGSGLKYKKCCLARSQGIRGYTRDERARILNKLREFVSSEPMAPVYQKAKQLFERGAPSIPEGPMHEHMRLNSGDAFEGWLFFDYRMKRQSLVLSEFLKMSPSLSPGEMAYLRQADKSAMRLYEVAGVSPGISIDLRDYISGDVVRIAEKTASRMVGKWDVLAARVMPEGATGKPEIDCGFFMYVRLDRTAVENELRERMADFRYARPSADELEFFKKMPPIFRRVWLRLSYSVFGEKMPSDSFEPWGFPQSALDVKDDADALEKQRKLFMEKWPDEPSASLDGLSPREAAKIPRLRPRVVDMLKDFENAYEKSLTGPAVFIDPAPLWVELGLDREPEAPKKRSHPLLTGYESMQRHVPEIAEVARKVASKYRERPDFDDRSAMEETVLGEDPVFSEFLMDETRRSHRQGLSRDHAVAHGNLIGAHLRYMCNYELHLRKTFWVEESLARMLSQTNLDIVGEVLKPPFPSFALVFTDRFTLEMCERLLSKVPDCDIRGRVLRIATVYVTRIDEAFGTGLNFSVTFDDLSDQWPYLVSRDLVVRPDANLDDIIDSHFPEVSVDELDPLFSSDMLKELLKLCVNTILYITSANVETEDRPGPAKRKRKDWTGTADAGSDPFVSSQDVVFLPGKINISRLENMRDMEQTGEGRRLMVRFMVRGHWRRANPNWKDQRPRWIEPSWKGPDMATIIERQYNVKS